MYRYKKILVHLNMHDDEKPLLRMAAKIAKMAQSELVIFSHFFEKTEVIDELHDAYPWLIYEPTEDAIMKRISKEVKETFEEVPGPRRDIRVDDVKPIYELLRIAKDEDIDLIIVSGGEHTTLPIRLARKAPCSVCVVPAHANIDYKKILVPIDFSTYAKDAMDVAASFGEAQHLKELIGMYVALIPEEGRARGILQEADFRRINEDFYNLKMIDFLKEINLCGLKCVQAIEHSDSVPLGILHAETRFKPDLIVIGCRGKDALSSLFLGSTAEAVIKHATVTVVAVKHKGTGVSFIKKLLGEHE